MQTLPACARVLLERTFGERWLRASCAAIERSSNWVVRIELDGERFALRVPQVGDAVTHVDRRSERCILEAAARAGLAPEVVACDEGTGTLLTRWIDGQTWTLERARDADAIVRFGQLLRSLHALAPPPEARQVDLPSLIDHYLDVSRDHAAFQTCWSLRDAARHRLSRRQSAAPVLCHNDAHHLNLVEAHRLYLVDWEYAGVNDAGFDLAGYASYHDLDSARTALLLDAYGAGTAAKAGLGDWRWIFEYVWALWLLATAQQFPPHATDTSVLQRLLARMQ